MLTETPDYSKYTVEELNQALQGIDKHRFPERVELIKEALDNSKTQEADEKIVPGNKADPLKEYLTNWLKGGAPIDLFWLLSISTVIIAAKGTHGVFSGIFIFIFPSTAIKVITPALLVSLIGFKFPQLKIAAALMCYFGVAYEVHMLIDKPESLYVFLATVSPFVTMTSIVLVISLLKIKKRSNS